jgi:hypothetical protein
VVGRAEAGGRHTAEADANVAIEAVGRSDRRFGSGARSDPSIARRRNSKHRHYGQRRCSQHRRGSQWTGIA